MNTHGSGSLPGRAGESLSLASETRRNRTRDPLALAERRRRRLTDRDRGNAGRGLAPRPPDKHRDGCRRPLGSAPALPSRQAIVTGRAESPIGSAHVWTPVTNEQLVG